jgi:hypothetical protein
MADGLFELLERDGALATPPRRRAYYLFEYVGHALCAKVAGYVERVSKREKAGEWQWRLVGAESRVRLEQLAAVLVAQRLHRRG